MDVILLIAVEEITKTVYVTDDVTGQIVEKTVTVTFDPTIIDKYTPDAKYTTYGKYQYVVILLNRTKSDILTAVNDIKAQEGVKELINLVSY